MVSVITHEKIYYLRGSFSEREYESDKLSLIVWLQKQVQKKQQ